VVKFHQTPTSGVGGVAFTRILDGLMDTLTDRSNTYYGRA